MLGQFQGLPLHALVVHAAVVFAPLTALAGIAFLVPRWRSALRWPLVASAAIATTTMFVAKQSGQALKTALRDQLNGNLTGRLVARHQQLGGELFIALLVLLGLAIVVTALRPEVSQTGSPSVRLKLVLAPLVTVVSVAVLVLTYQTGEAGAKARWNPDGSFDYSAK